MARSAQCPAGRGLGFGLVLGFILMSVIIDGRQQSRISIKKKKKNLSAQCYGYKSGRDNLTEDGSEAMVMQPEGGKKGQ